MRIDAELSRIILEISWIETLWIETESIQEIGEGTQFK